MPPDNIYWLYGQPMKAVTVTFERTVRARTEQEAIAIAKAQIAHPSTQPKEIV